MKTQMTRLFGIALLVLAAVVGGLADTCRAEDTVSKAPIIGKGTHAVLIALEDYKTEFTNEFAGKDLDRVKAFLAKVGVPEAQIHTYSNLTRSEIEELFGKGEGLRAGTIASKLPKSADSVFVYVNARCTFINDDFEEVLLGIDSDRDNAEITGYPMKSLYYALAEREADATVMFFDVDFSGEDIRVLEEERRQVRENGIRTRSLDQNLNEVIHPLHRIDNLVFFRSTGNDGVNYWDSFEESHLFTDSLLETTRRMSGKVTVREVLDQTRTAVMRASRDLYRKTQTPVIRVRSGSGVDADLEQRILFELPENTTLLASADNAQSSAQPMQFGLAFVPNLRQSSTVVIPESAAKTRGANFQQVTSSLNNEIAYESGVPTVKLGTVLELRLEPRQPVYIYCINYTQSSGEAIEIYPRSEEKEIPHESTLYLPKFMASEPIGTEYFISICAREPQREKIDALLKKLNKKKKWDAAQIEEELETMFAAEKQAEFSERSVNSQDYVAGPDNSGYIPAKTMMHITQGSEEIAWSVREYRIVE